MHPLALRQAAAQAAVDRFAGSAMAWSTNDCARLAAFTLRKLGYRPTMPKAGSYRSLVAARNVLARLGFASLEAALDAMSLPRITPAAALPGDLVAMPTPHDGWVALTVALGNGRLLGFMDAPQGPPICRVMQPTFAEDAHPLAAWRADPCRK